MKLTKKLIGITILLSIFTACGNKNKDVKKMPEGTADINIEVDDFNVNKDNVTNLTQYAKQVADLLTADATTLCNAWTKEYKGGKSYSESFKNPGIGETYTSYTSCIQEIIEGCADIANEVGTAKIGDPRDLWEKEQYTEAIYAVESWYSFHSIDDYANNIRSIRNAFNGSRNGVEEENSIASYVKKNNPELYTEVKEGINNAIASIESMVAPFRNHIGNSSVLVASEACAKLEKILSNQLKTYITSVENDEDLKPIIISYVDNVVVPTYNDLLEKNKALNNAVRALATNPSSATFATAANAWMQAREPWETSEAFLFGPVADLGLDPNMDSWPLDADALKNILDSAITWEGEYDEDDEKIEAAQNVRGFHTLEFLLFKDGEPRVYNQ